MNYLITGAAGFIGSNFSDYMVSKYPESNFIGYDNLTYAGKIENLDSVIDKNNFIFVRGNILDFELVLKTLKQYNVDIIVNFAAESHVDRSIEDSSIFLKTNIIGTQSLMDAALKLGIKRFHQVSTDEVYGDLPLDQSHLKFTEETPLNPSSPYAVSKAAADLLVMSYYRTHNLQVSISRCSNNYGPNQDSEKLIPKVINNALKNLNIPVYAEGKNIRDWIHVMDHVKALEMFIQSGEIGKVLNFGGENELSNLDLIRLILNILNKDYSLITFITDRKGHDLRYSIDNTKAKSILNWEPKYEFEKNLRLLIKSIQSKEVKI